MRKLSKPFTEAELTSLRAYGGTSVVAF